VEHAAAQSARRWMWCPATAAEHYPRAAAAASTLAGYISTQQYLWGLHRVLDGLTTATTDDPEDHEPH
jgi:hypothetical protein